MAESERDGAMKRASSLNTDNIRLRAELKRAGKAADSAAASAQRSGAELSEYQQEMRERSPAVTCTVYYGLVREYSAAGS